MVYFPIFQMFNFKIFQKLIIANCGVWSEETSEDIFLNNAQNTKILYMSGSKYISNTN